MSAETCAEPIANHACRTGFAVRAYDLAATLESGQAFRWRRAGDVWHGVLGDRAVRLRATPGQIAAEATGSSADWRWLSRYLQLEVDLDAIIATFPDDAPMRRAVAACGGLRLLRQDPWECLASFILSSTKQIVQIRQIVSLVSARFGEPIRQRKGFDPVDAGGVAVTLCAFPTPTRLAAAAESDLRACKMGFRAPYLLAAARRIAEGDLDLARLGSLDVAEAREVLMEIPGVGRKIADCVLLFGFGFQTAFPVDVWVMKALRELYFSGRNVPAREILSFAEHHFGPHAGYAQQYLFHYMRTGESQNARPSD